MYTTWCVVREVACARARQLAILILLQHAQTRRPPYMHTKGRAASQSSLLHAPFTLLGRWAATGICTGGCAQALLPTARSCPLHSRCSAATGSCTGDPCTFPPLLGLPHQTTRTHTCLGCVSGSLLYTPHTHPALRPYSSACCAAAGQGAAAGCCPAPAPPACWSGPTFQAAASCLT